MTKTSSELRHAWIEGLTAACRPYFLERGYTVPENVRVTIGYPKGGRGGKGQHAIGQCWDSITSTDKHFEIFISPSLKDSMQIGGVIVHELVHATVGIAASHGAVFRKAALAVGLQGKMTATSVGEELAEWIGKFVAKHGAYPAGAHVPGEGGSTGPKKQGTRLLKAICQCGYTVRVTQKWIDDAGAPRCGHRDHGRMEIE